MGQFTRAFFLLFLLTHGFDSIAQIDSLRLFERPAFGLFPKIDPGSDNSVKVSGYYRFFGTFTNQLDPYILNAAINDTVNRRSLFIGDDSQLPNLNLQVTGRSGERSSWGFDLMIFQFLNGAIGSSYGKQIPDSLRPNIQTPLSSIRLGGSLGMLLGMNLHGDFKTKTGSLRGHLGGIQWVNLSDLTMASFSGYNRFTLYERNPWDPTGTDIGTRYNQYFEQGSINQDNRWGNRAFVGGVLEGVDFPGRTSFTAMIGKTELNGGFSSVPNYSYGGKFKKEWGAKDFISVNSINSTSYTDSLALQSYGFNVVTLEWSLEKNGFQFRGEAGAGNYFSPTNKAGWSELMQVKFKTPMRNGFPSMELHAYRISPNVVNNNALYWNTSTPEYQANAIPAGSVGSSAVLQPFGSAMIRMGQMTNNRQGLNINLEAGKKKLKFTGGVGFSSEIKAAAPVITYTHPVNQFTRARFWRWGFPANVGPYNRYSHIFRDVYETVHLSDDSSGTTIHKKHFATFEGQVKYHTKIAGRDIYLFSLTQLSSSQRDFSPIVVTSEKAYIRQYTSEVEAYYMISRGLLLNGYFGIERTLGNYLTDIDEITRRPRNQYGQGFGLGCDIDMGKNARLYIRHRWYSFKDTSFELDQFKGRELTVEIKAFF